MQGLRADKRVVSHDAALIVLQVAEASSEGRSNDKTHQVDAQYILLLLLTAGHQEPFKALRGCARVCK